MPLDELERTYLQRVLESTGGMIEGTGGAAEILRLKTSTLSVQRADELVSREAGISLFDAFGSSEKTLHANTGRHAGIPAF